jgi:hypothetical protein
MTTIRQLTGAEYLEISAPAAKHFFDGLQRHVDLLAKVDWHDLGFRSSRDKTASEAAADIRRADSYRFAAGVISVSILQLADTGLSTCSQNVTVPSSCAHFVRSSKMARYCVGREIHGLPLGAIIHAARNQGIHWPDERVYDGTKDSPAGFNTFTQGVFEHLAAAHHHDMFMDLIYELGNPFYHGAPIRADAVLLTSLGWFDYSAYEKDMLEMLAPTY